MFFRQHAIYKSLTSLQQAHRMSPVVVTTRKEVMKLEKKERKLKLVRRVGKKEAKKKEENPGSLEDQNERGWL